MTEFVTNQAEIEELRDRGALFVINHSGGKDSQTMFIRVSQIVPKEQIIIAHAVLREINWEGELEHIRATVPTDIPLLVCHATKSFFEMVTHRGMWPSPTTRQCTSDLKRGPIEREIRHHLKKHNLPGLVVNCMGIRAEESPRRSKCVTFKFSKRNSKAGREWYDWLPIHHLLLPDVWATIKGADQKPHWVYAKGMTRLSCVFCIMASLNDLRVAAGLEPDTYARVVAKELEIDHTFVMPKRVKGKLILRTIEEVTGMKADSDLVAKWLPDGDPEAEVEIPECARSGSCAGDACCMADLPNS